MILFLLCLEFIIGLIESACPSLLITNPDPFLFNFLEAFSDVYLILESIICEEGLPLWEDMNNMHIIWRNIDAELDK